MQQHPQDSLFEPNMKLVYFVVNQHYSYLNNDEDFIQEGMIGLLKACRTWNSSKSKFSTYACRCILNELRMELRRRNRQFIESTSFDDTISESDSRTLKDVLTSKTDDFATVEFSIKLESMLDSLSPKERQIIKLLLVGNKQVDVANIVGCTRSYVSRLQTKFLKKLNR